MAKKTPKKRVFKNPGLLVSLHQAGVNFPGRGAVSAAWQSRQNRIKAGGKSRRK